MQEKLNITSSKHINGNNYTLNAESSDGWQGFYILHFYKTTGSVKDIKLTGGDAGLLVNGSKITLEGNIDVSGNEFGGIEVSKGQNVETEPELNVSNANLTNTTEAYGLPTIWEDEVGEDDEDNVINHNLTKIYVSEKSQKQYYIKNENSIPQKSTYEFAFTIPENIIANVENKIDVTFKAKEVKDEGYNKVRFKFGTTDKPEGSTVTFKATDTNQNEHTFTNEGVWGPDTGFPITKDYTATTNWKVIFSEAGEYTIEFKLIDLDNIDFAIATGSATVTVGTSEGDGITATIEVNEENIINIDGSVVLETDQEINDIAVKVYGNSVEPVISEDSTEEGIFTDGQFSFILAIPTELERGQYTVEIQVFLKGFEIPLKFTEVITI